MEKTKVKAIQKIKLFFSSFFKKSRRKEDLYKAKVFELHARVFALEKKLDQTNQTISELSTIVNKMSKVQYELANSYNSMVGELYNSYESDLTSSATGMLLFGLPTDDDDDLIN